jgi:hypothetical protein
MATAAAEYTDLKARAAERSRRAALAGRDIGDIPAIVNVRRREACRLDLRRFCETYNPEAFYARLVQDDQPEGDRIALRRWSGCRGALRLRDAARFGQDDALPDGGALGGGVRALPVRTFVIGANAAKAQDNLEAMKMFMRFLPLHGGLPGDRRTRQRSWRGIANRASGQTCDNEPTLIEWAQDRITLADGAAAEELAEGVGAAG